MMASKWTLLMLLCHQHAWEMFSTGLFLQSVSFDYARSFAIATATCAWIGECIREFVNCFFDFNPMDLALHIGKLAKEVEFRGQSHKAIFSSKPYSYWKAKVRRTYFDGNVTFWTVSCPLSNQVTSFMPTGARQIQLLEEWEKKWTSAAIGFDAVTGAWALVPELREERLRSIKALCAANRLTGANLLHLLLTNGPCCAS